MKKKTISTVCALICLTGLLLVCVRNIYNMQQNNMADDANADKQQAVEKVNTATETDAEKQYREFMNGTGSLMTAERFREDDSEYNSDGLLYGEYTCAELKENIEKLELTYFYEYGYRTEATLYEIGLLAIGGSWGAGAHGMDYYRFGENCEADRLFSNNAYIGSFATQIAYDLQTDQSEVLDPTGDSDLLTESRLEVSEYIPAEKNGEGVKLYASGYNEDAGVKAAEEKMMQDLAAQGAELISGDEMDRLCSIETGTEVRWEIP